MTDKLLGAKAILCVLYGVWGMIKKIHQFLGEHCSIGLKRQSEHSGLHPDTSSFVITNGRLDTPIY